MAERPHADDRVGRMEFILTLRRRGISNAAVLRAIDQAKRGEVLVIDAGGSERVTALGGTSSLAAKRRGLAGVVLNAACRDIDEIRAMRFPVYALGTSVRGTLRNHPGWLQVPVSVGGTTVEPGDYVLGDADGVVVIDTPQLPTRAVEMRKEAESHGPIRYLINTEHHVDHIFGNYYFKGDFPVVNHQALYDRFMVVFPDLDPYEYAREAIPCSWCRS